MQRFNEAVSRAWNPDPDPLPAIIARSRETMRCMKARAAQLSTAAEELESFAEKFGALIAQLESAHQDPERALAGCHDFNREAHRICAQFEQTLRTIESNPL